MLDFLLYSPCNTISSNLPSLSLIYCDKVDPLSDQTTTKLIKITIITHRKKRFNHYVIDVSHKRWYFSLGLFLNFILCPGYIYPAHYGQAGLGYWLFCLDIVLVFCSGH